MGKRFITARDIDELTERGETELCLDANTVVTDVARERARERGVSLRRGEGVAAQQDAPVSPAAAGSLEAAPADAALAAAVRRAVVAHLGHEPAGLQGVIARILQKRG
ncbi:hypothetical protein SAMN05920897_11144 [Alkalispirochaeta americana]|uniref:Uncharacterized protein n=1 Tax=Alkalispirochaeta americana TaxID=159291 RepID=A0A1N6TZN2_9SPIO|nr:hypothetical protein [Alkalispirochaeta americana]SIQ58546.1 hypothetical protein SAMN05920897_11144 [Alkalispirochaeta americana]